MAVELMKALQFVEMFRFFTDGRVMAGLLNSQREFPQNKNLMRLVGAQPVISEKMLIQARWARSVDRQSWAKYVSFSIMIAWHYTRTVCDFDPDLTEELERTEEGDVQVNIEQCNRFLGVPVLIPFDRPYRLGEVIVEGVFVGAHPDITGEATQIGIFPLAKNVQGKYDFSFNLIASPADGVDGFMSLEDVVASLFSDIEDCEDLEVCKREFFSKLAYLFTETPDVREGFNLSSPVPVRRRKRPDMLFAPDKPRVMPLGHDFGVQIRKHRLAASAEKGTVHGTVKPHIRRAHWHTYLSGKGREVRTLKWQLPIFVRSAEI